MESLIENLPLFLPIIILGLSLSIASLIDVLKHKNYRFGNRTFWIIMSFVEVIGPVIYFMFGRGEEE